MAFGHLLPPFLSEPFGGGAGLVDVEVERAPPHESIDPRVYYSIAKLNPACAPSRPATRGADTEGHAIAEIAYLLGRQLELVKCVTPVLGPAAHRITTLKSLHRPFYDDVRGIEVHCGVDVPGVHGVNQPLRTLH